MVYSLLEAYAMEDIIRGGGAAAICTECWASGEFRGFVSAMGD
jgi:hypothetical protein